MQPQKYPAQAILNGEVHNWYKTRLGFSDHLVAGLLDRFDLAPGDTVLDPFCGAGTTLVECMKRGLTSVGIDANPAACFAAKVKTSWNLDPARLNHFLDSVVKKYRASIHRSYAYASDPTLSYLYSSGMVQRGWISRRPLWKAVIVKRAIAAIEAPSRYKQALTLALSQLS